MMYIPIEQWRQTAKDIQAELEKCERIAHNAIDMQQRINNVFMWLGEARDRMQPQDVAALQDILGKPVLSPVDIKRETIAGSDDGKPLQAFQTLSMPLDGRYQWVIVRDDYNGENSQTRETKVLCVLADGTTEAQAREYVQQLMDKQRAEDAGKMIYPGEETYYIAVYTEIVTP